MINCAECNKRINSTNAVEMKGELVYYCKSCYERLFGADEDDSCHYCKNFTYDRSNYGYLQHIELRREQSVGLLGTCTKHNRTVTTHSQKCDDYEYAYTGEPYCTKEHIIKDCALNDNCRRADFNCDECHTKKFWENDVLANRERHVVGQQWSDGQVGVDSFTKGEGGYYNRRFDLHFEDGEVMEDMGLWSRGRAPNERVIKLIRHAKIVGR
ncbi:MAG: hypothetical protein IJF83_07175 [Methanobrevibacter sp.]|nr:hypothetical protein [Methanobrevibacter sp.]